MFLGNFEFQSEQFYFIDKPKKQEIRVRNGNTYFYEDVSTFFRKVGCVYPMIVVSKLPRAEIGRNDHWEDAHHFILYPLYITI